MPRGRKKKKSYKFVFNFLWFVLPIITGLLLFYLTPYLSKVKLERKVKQSRMNEIKTVFLIVLQNQNLKEVIKEGRYIESLLRGSAYAQNYYSDRIDVMNYYSRLMRLLENKGVGWRVYEEGREKASLGYVPYQKLQTDLLEGRVARFNLIRGDDCHSMKTCSVKAGDQWLAKELPKIITSPVYRDGGAVIITFASGSQVKPGQPILFLVISPYAKNGPQEKRYNHASLIRSLQEIFKLTDTPLVDFTSKSNLSALFIER